LHIVLRIDAGERVLELEMTSALQHFCLGHACERRQYGQPVRKAKLDKGAEPIAER
jgi:hypothetical protein